MQLHVFYLLQYAIDSSFHEFYTYRSKYLIRKTNMQIDVSRKCVTDNSEVWKMAGFFKKFVDKISGYSEDTDGEYDSEYPGDDYSPDQYNYPPQTQGFNQPQEQQYKAAPFQQEPRMQYAPPARSASAPKVVPIKTASPGEQQLVILQPNNIQSAQRVCDHLRAGHTVICNIENVDAKVAQRVIDFITGSTYAMDGNVRPIDARAHSFVAVPRNVSLVDKEVSAPADMDDYSEPFRMVR